MSLTAGLRRRRAPAAGIWFLAAGCWSILVALALTGNGHPGHHDVAGDAVTSGLIGVAEFLAGWLTMVGAMMLPAIAPAARDLAERSPARGRVPALVASFAGVWAAFGLLALAGDAGVHRLVERWAWLSARPALVLAVVLLGAGAFRLGTLWSAAARRGGPSLAVEARLGGGWRDGVRFGAASLVHDGPLMLVMFAAGPGDLGLMVALTVVMVAERDERRGGRVATLTGCALVAAAVVAVLAASGA